MHSVISSSTSRSTRTVSSAENNVTMFTSLDTVKVLLDVLEEITLGVSTIDAE